MNMRLGKYIGITLIVLLTMTAFSVMNPIHKSEGAATLTVTPTWVVAETTGEITFTFTGMTAATAVTILIPGGVAGAKDECWSVPSPSDVKVEGAMAPARVAVYTFLWLNQENAFAQIMEGATARKRIQYQPANNVLFNLAGAFVPSFNTAGGQLASSPNWNQLSLSDMKALVRVYGGTAATSVTVKIKLTAPRIAQLSEFVACEGDFYQSIQYIGTWPTDAPTSWSVGTPVGTGVANYEWLSSYRSAVIHNQNINDGGVYVIESQTPELGANVTGRVYMNYMGYGPGSLVQGAWVYFMKDGVIQAQARTRGAYQAIGVQWDGGDYILTGLSPGTYNVVAQKKPRLTGTTTTVQGYSKVEPVISTLGSKTSNTVINVPVGRGAHLYGTVKRLVNNDPTYVYNQAPGANNLKLEVWEAGTTNLLGRVRLPFGSAAATDDTVEYDMWGVQPGAVDVTVQMDPLTQTAGVAYNYYKVKKTVTVTEGGAAEVGWVLDQEKLRVGGAIKARLRVGSGQPTVQDNAVPANTRGIGRIALEVTGPDGLVAKSYNNRLIAGAGIGTGPADYLEIYVSGLEPGKSYTVTVKMDPTDISTVTGTVNPDGTVTAPTGANPDGVAGPANHPRDGWIYAAPTHFCTNYATQKYTTGTAVEAGLETITFPDLDQGAAVNVKVRGSDAAVLGTTLDDMRLSVLDGAGNLLSFRDVTVTTASVEYLLYGLPTATEVTVKATMRPMREHLGYTIYQRNFLAKTMKITTGGTGGQTQVEWNEPLKTWFTEGALIDVAVRPPLTVPVGAITGMGSYILVKDSAGATLASLLLGPATPYTEDLFVTYTLSGFPESEAGKLFVTVQPCTYQTGTNLAWTPWAAQTKPNPLKTVLDTNQRIDYAIQKAPVISGKVEYMRTPTQKRPIPWVTVDVTGSPGVTATTDSIGQYKVDYLPAGTYTVTASKPGFEKAPSAKITVDPIVTVADLPFSFTPTAAVIPEFPVGAVFALLSTFGVALYLLRWTRRELVAV